jgi:hypothetical protein
MLVQFTCSKENTGVEGSEYKVETSHLNEGAAHIQDMVVIPI